MSATASSIRSGIGHRALQHRDEARDVGIAMERSDDMLCRGGRGRQV